MVNNCVAGLVDTGYSGQLGVVNSCVAGLVDTDSCVAGLVDTVDS